MSVLNVAEVLNSLVKGYNSELKFNTVFYQGEFNALTKRVISEIAPYGKVAFVSYETSFTSTVKPLAAELGKNGNKTVAMVFKNGSDDTIKSASRLFALPEDVRAVVTVDAGLYRLCSYYANIKRIPVICGIFSFDVRGVCDNDVFLKNGDKVDKIRINTDRYVIIDQNILTDSADFYNGYANVVSRTVSLIDYRMVCANDGRNPSPYLYNHFRSAVVETFNLDWLTEKERNASLLKNTLTVELINALSQGRFITESAETVVVRLINGFKANYDYGLLLYASAKILGVYDAYFNCKSSVLLTITDYNGIIDALTDDFGLNEGQITEELKIQIARAKKGRSRSEGAKFKIKKEVANLYALSPQTLKWFTETGGKFEFEKARLKSALKHCGDFYGFNTMSLARESGVTEFIK